MIYGSCMKWVIPGKSFLKKSQSRLGFDRFIAFPIMIQWSKLLKRTLNKSYTSLHKVIIFGMLEFIFSVQSINNFKD